MQKIKFIYVEPLHAATVNCVSQEVTNKIFLAVCREFASDWGIGIKGYASAVLESGNRVFAFFPFVTGTKSRIRDNRKAGRQILSGYKWIMATRFWKNCSAVWSAAMANKS